jgi:hypothetical protein
MPKSSEEVKGLGKETRIVFQVPLAVLVIRKHAKYNRDTRSRNTGRDSRILLGRGSLGILS